METPTLALLSVFLLSLITTWTEGAITCQAMTSSYETKVTCFFHVDLSTTMHNFNVHLYYPDLQAKPVNMLTCNWFSSDTIRCVKGPGVTFNNIVSDQLTLRGPPSRDKVGGQFACDVVPSSDQMVEPCTLVFNESAKPVSRVTEAEVEMDREHGPSGLSIVTAVGFFTCLLVFAVYCLVKNWPRIRQMCAAREAPSVKYSEEDSKLGGAGAPLIRQPNATIIPLEKLSEPSVVPAVAVISEETETTPTAPVQALAVAYEVVSGVDPSEEPLPSDESDKEKEELTKKERKKQEKEWKKKEEARKKEEKEEKKRQEKEDKRKKKEGKKNKNVQSEEEFWRPRHA